MDIHNAKVTQDLLGSNMTHYREAGHDSITSLQLGVLAVMVSLGVIIVPIGLLLCVFKVHQQPSDDIETETSSNVTDRPSLDCHLWRFWNSSHHDNSNTLNNTLSKQLLGDNRPV